jgi:iron complex transport system substrate-binding protein
MRDINKITYDIIGAAIRIHRRLGCGLLESAYHDLMFRDLVRAEYFVQSKKRVGFEFEGAWIENGLTTDLIVERIVIVELKVAVAVAPVHERQLLTYLRLTELPVGLLINFGGEVLYKNTRRFVNNLKE